MRAGSAFAHALMVALAGAVGADAEEDATREPADEEIVVTGSRIPRRDVTTPAPVRIIDRQEIESSGRLSLGDYLQSIPEQRNAANTQSNPGDGSTRISLRGLGDNRTLVLVNGRRWVPSAGGASTAADLSALLSAVVDRVEILKDGASALYGTDSIGGVVNLITRRRFDGAEFAVAGGVSPHGDAQTLRADFTVGHVGERSHLLFVGGFFDQQPVWASRRNATQYFLQYNALTGAVTPQGSRQIPAGAVVLPSGSIGKPVQNPNHDPRIDLFNALVTKYPTSSRFVPDPSQPLGWRPYRGDSLDLDGYNFQPDNYDLTPNRRVGLFSTGDFRFAAAARAYYEASFVNRQSSQQQAPESLFTNLNLARISKDNAYNPFGVDLTNVQRRMVEWGPRGYQEDVDSLRVVAGLDGAVPALGWSWDGSVTYGRTQQANTNTGQENPASLRAALGPTWRDPTGRVHCGTDVSNDIQGCVPLDLLHGPGSVTAAQRDYATFTGTARDLDQLTVVQINTAADLFRLTSRPVAIAAGYEYRLLFGSAVPDVLSVSMGNGQILHGGYHSNEGYAELSLPVAEGVPGIQAVEVMGAGRVFDYSSVGRGVTYKAGLRWTVGAGVTFRGTFSTAFRAPSISELYTPQTNTVLGLADPCAGRVDPSTPVGRACGENAGNPGGDAVVVTGGNQALRPETAQIATAGVVLQPAFTRELSVTADLFRISIDNAIVGAPGVGVVFDGCYTGPRAETSPRLCELVKRDPGTHAITAVYDLAQNVGNYTTDGIDLALRYALPTTVGRFGFRLDGTWLHRFDVTLADDRRIEARGTFDQGVNPSIRSSAGINWSLGAFSAAVSTRYVGGFDECGCGPGNPFCPAALLGTFGSVNPSSPGRCFLDPTYRHRVHAWNSSDLFASYAFSNAAGRTILAVGVNNVFNTPPPTIFNAGGYDPQTYDLVGRFVYGRLEHRF